MSAAGPKKEFYEALSPADLLRIFAEKIEDLERDLVGETEKFVRGASATRVPSDKTAQITEEWGFCATHGNYRKANPCGCPMVWPTRECEGCGAHKPIEEMAVCFLPGTGESCQCDACRGGP